jgi:hypothetical protein
MSISRILKRAAGALIAEDKTVFLGKTLRNLRVRGRRVTGLYHYRNVRRWRQLRNRFAGKRAFLVGNGPSLNVTPLHLLRGEHVLCFNRFSLMYERLPWRPTMYMNVDTAVVMDMAQEIPGVIEDVPYAFFPDFHTEGGNVRGLIGDLPNVYWMYPGFGGFYDDLPHYGLGATVAYTGLQVLAYLGFDPIYLVGVDMEYRRHTTARVEGSAIRSQADDDPNHFDPRYFGKGRLYHQPDDVVMDGIRRAFDRAATALAARRIAAKNATIGGSLAAFERVDFRSLFGPERDRSWEMAALEQVAERISGASPAGLSAAAVIEEPDDTLMARDVFSLGQEHAKAWIPRLIYTHIPLGPVSGGTTYFVSRRTPERP